MTDNSQKFVAGSEMTMSIKPTSDEYPLIRAWAAMVPTLHMLDICVVGATKLKEDALKKDPRKTRLIDELRKLDQSHHSFSYLFALMEKVSDTRGKLSIDELREQLLIDILALRSFFKKAQVLESDDYLISYLDQLTGNPIEDKRKEKLYFLQRLNDFFKLHNPISPKYRLQLAKNIIQEAKSLNISTQHPILIIGLACVYGNKSAKKLMKFKADPKKFDAQNALADLLLITRFAKIKLQIEHYGRMGHGYPNVKFFTDDDGLYQLLKCFKPLSVENYDRDDGGQTSKITITVDVKLLLTEATKEDYTALTDFLLS